MRDLERRNNFLKIVILDGYTLNPGDLSWEPLKELGEVIYYDRTSSKDVIAHIKDANIVLTNEVPINARTLNMCQNIVYIGVLSTGYNHIDVETARDKGIVVSNIPDYGTEAVSQYTIALLLEACHRIGAHSELVKQGAWSKSQDFCFWNYPLICLDGKTLGIIGAGKIGRRTAKIAEAMGMNILVYNRYKNPELDSSGMNQVTLDELMQRSDVISLHCPINPQSKQIINAASISKMKEGVIIVNTARGGLINENDLLDALNHEKVSIAALDVASIEPIPDNSKLLSHPNVILTPHIAWAAKEAREKMMYWAVENLRKYLHHEELNRV